MKRSIALGALMGVLLLWGVMAAGGAAVAQQAASASPVPSSTATPTFEERYGETIVGRIIGPLVVLVVGGVLGAIATVVFRPRIQYWAKRRELKLDARAREREAKGKAKRRRGARGWRVGRRRVRDARLRAYLDRVADLYSTTRIFIQSDPVLLDEIYTQVYLLERPEAERRFDMRRLQADPGLLERHERVEGQAHLETDEAHRLFILGKPGAGKTTFLRHLARQAATGAIDKIPVLVTLREWVDVDERSRGEKKGGVDLRSFVIEQFEVCNYPDAAAYVDHLLEETDKGLVLLDGLDEIRQEGGGRERAMATLQGFGRRYERAQVLITCRVAATEHGFEGFRYVEMADFDDEQVEIFVGNWFRESAKKRESFVRELAKGGNRGLRELARTPLLLGLLCLSFEETLAFPRHRDEIYTEALEALLRKWDARRSIKRDEIYRDLSPKYKRRLFARIAYETFEQGDYFIPQDELEERIVAYLGDLPEADRAGATVEGETDGEAVLRAIEAQHGILVERARGIHAFAHLTFQEFYAACYVVENAGAGTIPRLLAHCAEDRWREVILLSASMLGSPDAFLECYLSTVDGLVREDEQLVTLLTWAAGKAAGVTLHYRSAAVRSYYVFVAVDRAFDRAFGLFSMFARDRAVDLARALEQGLDIACNRDLYLTVGDELDRDLARACNRALYLALDRAHDLARDFARDLALDLEHARSLCRTLGLDGLHQALSELVVPAEDAPPEAWRDLTEGLQVIMIEHRNIGQECDLRGKQWRTLERYLYATQLLVRCLDYACGVDRSAIEARLLLPPGWDEAEKAQRGAVQ